MVGQWTVTKPSRSDEVLDANQQLDITNQIRAQFDSIAPKWPAKPNRNESELETISPPTATDQNNIPKLDNLQSLQSQSPVIFFHCELFLLLKPIWDFFLFFNLAKKDDDCQVIFSTEGANMEQEEFVET